MEVAELNGTPSSRSFLKAEEKSLKKRSSSSAYFTTHSREE